MRPPGVRAFPDIREAAGGKCKSAHLGSGGCSTDLTGHLTADTSHGRGCEVYVVDHMPSWRNV
jgi:hypothetical protein